MRMSLAALSFLLVAGCTVQEDLVGSSDCRTPPIEAFCMSCETYDERVRRIEASADSRCREPLGTLRVGTCGDLRYTSEGAAFGGGVQYFDAAGDLVASEWGSDVPNPDGCWTVPYGFIPRCEHKVSRDLCTPLSSGGPFGIGAADGQSGCV